MAKDYTRRRLSSSKGYTPKQFLGLIAAFLIGYLTANVFDLTSLNQWLHNQILSSEAQEAQIKSPVAQDKLPKPKFEFYTLLAKDQNSMKALPKPEASSAAAPVNLPPTVTKNTHDAPTNILPTAHIASKALANKNNNLAANSVSGQVNGNSNTSKDSYSIQIASFNKKQDAEHMKAGLLLKGFEVSIVAAPQGGWFRVILGPYPSRQEAEKIQLIIAKSERIKGMLRKNA